MKYKTMQIEGFEASSWEIQPLPVSGDVLDLRCDNCRKKHMALAAEVIQYGIEDDRHSYFVVCLSCGKQYTVDALMSFSGE